jgi:hypothetical protein
MFLFSILNTKLDFYVLSVNKIRLKFYVYLYLFYIKYHNLNLTVSSYNRGDVYLCNF